MFEEKDYRNKCAAEYCGEINHESKALFIKLMVEYQKTFMDYYKEDMDELFRKDYEQNKVNELYEGGIALSEEDKASRAFMKWLIRISGLATFYTMCLGLESLELFDEYDVGVLYDGEMLNCLKLGYDINRDETIDDIDLVKGMIYEVRPACFGGSIGK